MWDYYVDLTLWSSTNNNAGKYNHDPVAGNCNLYSIVDPIASGPYILSGTDNYGGWGGFLIRDNHPIAYAGTTGVDTNQDVYFSGWGSVPSSHYSFDFTGLSDGGLDVGNSFTVGWTVNCANDVLFIPASTLTPEPATLFLVGSGLVITGWFGRRKHRKGSTPQ